jgi:fumarate hydratase class I
MIFRLVDDRNPDPKLAALETRLLEELNRLGIGPMGFGGETTVLGVKVGAAHRLPASYFVSVAYECWACRRASVEIGQGRPRYGQVAVAARPYLRGGKR